MEQRQSPARMMSQRRDSDTPNSVFTPNNNLNYEPQFTAVAEPDSEFVTVKYKIDLLESIPTDHQSVYVSKNIGPLLAAALENLVDNHHINVTHCVIDSTTLNCAISHHPAAVAVQCNLNQFNNNLITGRFTPGMNESIDHLKGCFALQPEQALSKLKIQEHKETSGKTAVLQRYGDITSSELLSDVLLTKDKNWAIVRPSSPLMYALVVNWKQKNLVKVQETDTATYFYTEHLKGIVRIVEKHRKDHVDYIDLTNMKFSICRRDGLAFDDTQGTSYEKSYNSLREIKSSFDVQFTLTFAVKMFKNRQKAFLDTLEEPKTELQTKPIYLPRASNNNNININNNEVSPKMMARSYMAASEYSRLQYGAECVD